MMNMESLQKQKKAELKKAAKEMVAKLEKAEKQLKVDVKLDTIKDDDLRVLKEYESAWLGAAGVWWKSDTGEDMSKVMNMRMSQGVWIAPKGSKLDEVKKRTAEALKAYNFESGISIEDSYDIKDIMEEA